LRVVPAVSDQVTVLARYLPKPSRSVLVYDASTVDLYAKSLRADLKQAFGPSLNAGAGEIPYVPSTLDSALFKKIAQDLCAVQAICSIADRQVRTFTTVVWLAPSSGSTTVSSRWTVSRPISATRRCPMYGTAATAGRS
jgi:hypothetical protein